MHCLVRGDTRQNDRGGFTMVEALVSLTVTMLAGTALLLGLSSTLNTTEETLDRAMAQELAMQLLDELAGLRYAESGLGGRQTTLGPESGETNQNLRTGFDDLDDYQGYTSRPPVDPWGKPLGQDDGAGGLRHASFRIPDSVFADWRQEVLVQYVAIASPKVPLASGQTSDYRLATVKIVQVMPNGGSLTLAEVSRIFSYVPNN